MILKTSCPYCKSLNQVNPRELMIIDAKRLVQRCENLDCERYYVVFIEFMPTIRTMKIQGERYESESSRQSITQ